MAYLPIIAAFVMGTILCLASTLLTWAAPTAGIVTFAVMLAGCAVLAVLAATVWRTSGDGGEPNAGEIATDDLSHRLTTLSDITSHHVARIYTRLNALESARAPELTTADGAEAAQ